LVKHANLKLNKSLGQHFLTDKQVLQQIVAAINIHAADLPLVEIGPGAGALSSYLKNRSDYRLIEFDNRWASYLPETFPELKDKIINEDALQVDFSKVFSGEFAVVGNFPYNISSQILFKILDNKAQVPAMVGMFQKEVAERVCSKEGSKAYGILSVLIQAFYEVEYLFDVPREAFNPPPQVISGVMMMKRKDSQTLPCNEVLFKNLIKTGFNQRRKTLRNCLKPFLNENIKDLEVFDMRPEQLSVEAFINLTNIIEYRN
jgi:16S rRNA (adenine1518-N6/adenine1519-N6)-dimethyltransferase